MFYSNQVLESWALNIANHLLIDWPRNVLKPIMIVNHILSFWWKRKPQKNPFIICIINHNIQTISIRIDTQIHHLLHNIINLVSVFPDNSICHCLMTYSQNTKHKVLYSYSLSFGLNGEVSLLCTVSIISSLDLWPLSRQAATLQNGWLKKGVCIIHIIRCNTY